MACLDLWTGLSKQGGNWVSGGGERGKGGVQVLSRAEYRQTPQSGTGRQRIPDRRSDETETAISKRFKFYVQGFLQSVLLEDRGVCGDGGRE